MSPRENRRGLAVVCLPDGAIQRVIRDDLSLVRKGAERLQDVVDSLSADKASAFLERVTRDGSAFGWELNVADGSRVTSLHFAGAEGGGNVLIVGASEGENIERMLEELMAVNNDQANALRAALRERADDADPRRRSRHDQLYDDLSRVNNELANTQRELARREVELTRLNDEKNRFLGMAAHDLRNPLSIVHSYSGMLETEAAERLTAEEQEWLTEVRYAAQYMLELINDLLDVAKIDSGRVKVSAETIDVAAFVDRVIRHARYLADQKKITISSEVAEDAPRLVATDPTKLHQIVLNLLNNAVRYSEESTSIRVVVSSAGAGSWTIAVHDEGRGISPDDIERIFRPFERVAPDEQRGAGLGLVIVDRLVEILDGRVSVQSELGKGSTFTVTLPR